jgi:hypothetical protein
LPTALLALEKLNELNVKGLTLNSSMITEAAFSGQSPVYNNPNSTDGRPTMEEYIKKIFLVSDNDALTGYMNSLDSNTSTINCIRRVIKKQIYFIGYPYF